MYRIVPGKKPASAAADQKADNEISPNDRDLSIELNRQPRVAIRADMHSLLPIRAKATAYRTRTARIRGRKNLLPSRKPAG